MSENPISENPIEYPGSVESPLWHEFDSEGTYEISVDNSIRSIRVSAPPQRMVIRTDVSSYVDSHGVQQQAPVYWYLQDGNETSSFNIANVPLDSSVVNAMQGLLSAVISGSNIQQIGEACFYGCSNLSSVYLGPQVEQIGPSAFYECSSLSSMNVPDRVKYIGDACFCGCSELSGIEIRKNITTIPDDAFRGCSKLKTAILPKAVTNFGARAFKDCSSLSSINVLEDSAAVIYQLGDEAFMETGISSVVVNSFESDSQSIGANVFKNCRSLKTARLYAESYLGYGMFEGCTGLSSVELLNNNSTFIGNRCFADCTSLSSVYIPRSYVGISQSMFAGCTSLNSVLMDPDSAVAYVDSKAFDGCTALKELSCPSQISAYRSMSKTALSGSYLDTVYIPGFSQADIEKKHKSAIDTSARKYIIRDNDDWIYGKFNPGVWYQFDNDNNFKAVLQYAWNNNIPFLLTVGSSWCPHSRDWQNQMMDPSFMQWVMRSNYMFVNWYSDGRSIWDQPYWRSSIYPYIRDRLETRKNGKTTTEYVSLEAFHYMWHKQDGSVVALYNPSTGQMSRAQYMDSIFGSYVPARRNSGGSFNIDEETFDGWGCPDGCKFVLSDTLKYQIVVNGGNRELKKLS